MLFIISCSGNTGVKARDMFIRGASIIFSIK